VFRLAELQLGSWIRTSVAGSRLGKNLATMNMSTREPRWPAFLAMLSAAGVFWALPEPLSLGPGWLMLAVIFVLMIPIVITNKRGYFKITRMLTFIALTLITVSLIASLVFLIQGIPSHREMPRALLRSALALWITNILVFALWYWKLDAGGPLGRDHARCRIASAFLFPQLATNREDYEGWSPQFLDYLFVAFNTSTAFSPTDTAVLARWAKVVTMLQSLISLSILVLLAARAVNIL
jgi:uncharacterized membrane protein